MAAVPIGIAEIIWRCQGCGICVRRLPLVAVCARAAESDVPRSVVHIPLHGAGGSNDWRRSAGHNRAVFAANAGQPVRLGWIAVVVGIV